MRGRAAGLAGLLLAGSVAAPAVAQDYGGFARRGTPGDFDFYVLALSWSPTYCAGPGTRRDDVQCAPGRGLGFVVHGLWPQYASGYPQNCSAVNRAPTRQAMEVAGQVYPSEGLARYEWRKHGTCTGEDPASYFRLARRARDAVKIPEAFRTGSGQRVAPVEVARQFVLGNPGLRPDMMAVTCRSGRLEEVRICFSKDLRSFTSCPEVARQNCRADAVTAEAGR